MNTEQPLFVRSARARGSIGLRASGGLRLGVGSDRLHRGQDRMCAGDAAHLGSPSRARSGAARRQTTDEPERIKAFERENRGLKRANEIFAIAPPRILPRRSSAADASHGGRYRRLSRCLRCRADLPSCADRTVGVSRDQRPRACCRLARRRARGHFVARQGAVRVV
jgi:hypothetical protein